MRSPARTPNVLVLLTLLLPGLVAGGCGDDEGSAASKSDRGADTTEQVDDTASKDAVVANLQVRLEHVGDKSSGAGIPIPAGLACTRSIPATCRTEHECPAAEPSEEGLCAWLATDDARDLLLKEPPANQICTEQYGGAEVATVTGTLDGEAVDATFSRTNGCEISRFDQAAPLWTRDAPPAAGGRGEATRTAEPEEISDPPEAFDR